MIGQYNSKSYNITFIVAWSLLAAFNIGIMVWNTSMVFDYSRDLVNRSICGVLAFVNMAAAIWCIVNSWNFVNRLRNS